LLETCQPFPLDTLCLLYYYVVGSDFFFLVPVAKRKIFYSVPIKLFK
jgi:hypothetical protein